MYVSQDNSGERSVPRCARRLQRPPAESPPAPRPSLLPPCRGAEGPSGVYLRRRAPTPPPVPAPSRSRQVPGPSHAGTRAGSRTEPGPWPPLTRSLPPGRLTDEDAQVLEAGERVLAGVQHLLRGFPHVPVRLLGEHPAGPGPGAALQRRTAASGSARTGAPT